MYIYLIFHLPNGFNILRKSVSNFKMIEYVDEATSKLEDDTQLFQRHTFIVKMNENDVKQRIYHYYPWSEEINDANKIYIKQEN